MTQLNKLAEGKIRNGNPSQRLLDRDGGKRYGGLVWEVAVEKNRID